MVNKTLLTFLNVLITNTKSVKNFSYYNQLILT